jgi:hypothetical protein
MRSAGVSGVRTLRHRAQSLGTAGWFYDSAGALLQLWLGERVSSILSRAIIVERCRLDLSRDEPVRSMGRTIDNQRFRFKKCCDQSPTTRLLINGQDEIHRSGTPDLIVALCSRSKGQGSPLFPPMEEHGGARPSTAVRPPEISNPASTNTITRFTPPTRN